MDIKDQIKDAMHLLSSMNGGRRVVLHLDASSIRVRDGGQELSLPVMDVDHDSGFYRFPEPMREDVARYFGPEAKGARARIDEINLELGVTPEQARELVRGNIARARQH